MSLLSLPRLGARSRRLVVCGTVAAAVLLPGVAQAETPAAVPAAESSVAPEPAAAAATTAAATDAPVTDAPAAEVPAAPTTAVEPTTPAPGAEVTDPAEESTEVVEGEESAEVVEGDVVEDEAAAEGSAGTEVPAEEETAPGMPVMDPAVLAELFVPICETGELTGLTLQLDELQGLLRELQASGFPVPEEALAEVGTGTLDIPLDDELLQELATELNAASAEFADLGLTDADLDAALAELPADVRDDVETLIGQLQTGTVQAATLRGLLEELFPCPAAPVAPAQPAEPVHYLGYAPTGTDGPTGGSPLALLGGGAALLAGAGLFTASALRTRAARS